MTGFGDIENLIAAIEYRRDVLLPERVVAIMEEAVKHGEKEMAKILDSSGSFTRTGEERVASGKGDFAGRHVTGTMIDSLDSHIDVIPGVDEITVVGTFGWSDPEDYFLYQDWGTTDHVPAAHSLQKSFLSTTEALGAAIDAAGGA